MSEDMERILEEVLIARVTDGEATNRDWAEVERLAEQDPLLWRRLAEAQRSHALLSRAVEDQIAVAELIEAPAGVRTGVLATIGRVREYSGWAIAAMLALIFVGARLGWLGAMGLGSGSQQAGFITVPVADTTMTPDDAWAAYIDKGTQTGQVLGEMPAMVVEARPIHSEGGTTYEVVVVKRVITVERVTDPTMLRVQRNDAGDAVLIPNGSGFPASSEQPL